MATIKMISQRGRSSAHKKGIFMRGSVTLLAAIPVMVEEGVLGIVESTSEAGVVVSSGTA